MSKVKNKPNLRQFEVVKTYFDDEEHKWKDEHLYTTDSFKEAIKIAYETYGKVDQYISITIACYEADGETLVNRWYTMDIINLYKIRQYLI